MIDPANQVRLSTCLRHALAPAADAYDKALREQYPDSPDRWSDSMAGDIPGNDAVVQRAYARRRIGQSEMEVLNALRRAGTRYVSDVRQGALVAPGECFVCSSLR